MNFYKIIFALVVLIMSTISLVFFNYEKPTLIETGEIKIVTEYSESYNFVHCSCIIAQFGDSAVFVHALPTTGYSREYILPRIWNKELFTDHEATTISAIQRILTITDSLRIDRSRLNLYIVVDNGSAGEEALLDILPSVDHYGLHIACITVDEQRTENLYRTISFNPRTAILNVSHTDKHNDN